MDISIETIKFLHWFDYLSVFSDEINSDEIIKKFDQFNLVHYNIFDSDRIKADLAKLDGFRCSKSKHFGGERDFDPIYYTVTLLPAWSWNRKIKLEYVGVLTA